MDKSIPFHQYDFDDLEIEAVTEVLKSGWLTMGNKTASFEEAFKAYQGGKGYAIAVGSCSFGLQLMVQALKELNGKEDKLPLGEIIIPVNTFYATASAVIHQGLKPVFCDIDPETLLIDLEDAFSKVNEHTQALFTVHVGGNMPNMDALLKNTQKHHIALLEDCAHAIEAQYAGIPAGQWGLGGSFSFYPNKNITTGEGGIVTTQDERFAHRIRLLRNHGIDYTTYDRSNLKGGFRQYDIIAHGHKFNMTDIQASLGLVQLVKINSFYDKRKDIVTKYDNAFLPTGLIKRPLISEECQSAHHLYIVQLELEKITLNRDQIIETLAQKGIQTSVHYKPLHLMSIFGHQKGMFPKAEFAYERTLTLPLYPKMTNEQVNYVIETFLEVLEQSTV